ncbi:hypothetical protein Tco_0639203 [Tanacetum coccineum]
MLCVNDFSFLRCFALCRFRPLTALTSPLIMKPFKSLDWKVRTFPVVGRGSWLVRWWGRWLKDVSAPTGGCDSLDQEPKVIEESRLPSTQSSPILTHHRDLVLDLDSLFPFSMVADTATILMGQSVHMMTALEVEEGWTVTLIRLAVDILRVIHFRFGDAIVWVSDETHLEAGCWSREISGQRGIVEFALLRDCTLWDRGNCARLLTDSSAGMDTSCRWEVEEAHVEPYRRCLAPDLEPQSMTVRSLKNWSAPERETEGKWKWRKWITGGMVKEMEIGNEESSGLELKACSRIDPVLKGLGVVVLVCVLSVVTDAKKTELLIVVRIDLTNDGQEGQGLCLQDMRCCWWDIEVGREVYDWDFLDHTMLTSAVWKEPGRFREGPVPKLRKIRNRGNQQETRNETRLGKVTMWMVETRNYGEKLMNLVEEGKQNPDFLLSLSTVETVKLNIHIVHEDHQKFNCRKDVKFIWAQMSLPEDFASVLQHARQVEFQIDLGHMVLHLVARAPNRRSCIPVVEANKLVYCQPDSWLYRGIHSENFVTVRIRYHPGKKGNVGRGRGAGYECLLGIQALTLVEFSYNKTDTIPALRLLPCEAVCLMGESVDHPSAGLKLWDSQLLAQRSFTRIETERIVNSQRCHIHTALISKLTTKIEIHLKKLSGRIEGPLRGSKRLKQKSLFRLSKYAGTPGEVLSSPGSVKTKCKRNTRTFSPTLHPLQRLRPKL